MTASRTNREAAAARFLLAGNGRLADALDRIARTRSPLPLPAEVSDIRAAVDLIRAIHPLSTDGSSL